MDDYAPKAVQLPDRTLGQIEREIEAGLPNEQESLRHAIFNYDYYKMNGRMHIPYRDVEQDFDYRMRSRKSLPFVRRVIDVLASHLYCPGPARHLDGEPEATDVLAQVYADNLINSLWQKADRMSTLNGWCAFQVSSQADADCPIKIQLWGREQLAAWPDPEDASRIASVVTIDRYDETTRYTWWTAQEKKVYETEKLAPNAPPVQRAARYRADLSEPNTYGCLPFAFVHYDLPTDDFNTTGVGDVLRHANAEVDIEISKLAEAVDRFHAPLGVAYDCDVDFHPIAQAGKFLRVMRKASDLEANIIPRLEYLQAQLDIAGGWENVRQFLNSTLEGVGVPLSAVRMEQVQVGSGIQIIAEQAPLLSRAKERQEPFRRYECELAAIVLWILAKMGGHPEVARAARKPKLLLAWPEPSIPIPGPDRDANDQAEIQLGITSPVMIAMRRYGLTRDQALEHIKRVSEDNAAMAKLFPSGTPGQGQGEARPTDDKPTEDPEDDPVEDDELDDDGDDA